MTHRRDLHTLEPSNARAEPRAIVHHPGAAADEAAPLLLGADERLTRGNLPGLELLHDRFARMLRPIIQRELDPHAAVNAETPVFDTAHRVLKRLPIPVHLHLVRLAPLPGRAALVFSEALIDAVIANAFGAQPARGAKRRPSPRGTRGCTPIEERLLAKLAMRMLDILRDSWSSAAALDPIYMSVESSPLALTELAPSDPVIVLPITMRSDHLDATLELIIPARTLEPIKGVLAAGHSREAEGAVDRPDDPRVRAALAGAEVELSAILATGKIRVRDFLKLAVGDLIPLDTPHDAPAVVSVCGTPKLRGKAGIKGGRHAIDLGDECRLDAPASSPLRR